MGDNRRSERTVVAERYSVDSLHEERTYGFYWYDWLWRVFRPVLVFICSLLLVIGMISYGYNRVYSGLFGPVDSENTEMVWFDIASGSSITAVGNKLEREGLVRSATVFKYLVQFEGIEKQLSYGSYYLSPSMTLNQVLDELTSGSQTNERTITIIPGWSCRDVAAYLLDLGIISTKEEFYVECNNVDRFVADSYALRYAQDRDALDGRAYALEGYLAPDTYRVFRSANASSIIATLLSQHNKVIDNVFYSQDIEYEIDESGAYVPVERYQSSLSMDETIILASIIEKEAALTEDYPRVSAVLHNRLREGMKLESVPTATYWFGTNHYILTREEISDDNPYNTYVREGLPAGPICNPSTAALKAALNPDRKYIREGYLYYSAGDPATGEILYARTRDEYTANTAKYQGLWVAADASGH